MTRCGLTLIEIVITTALMLLATGLVASLAGDLGQTLRYDAQLDRAQEAAQVGLAQIRSEASEAVDFLTPDRASLTFPQATPDARLEFMRLDPEASRLPANPLPGPGSWNPMATAYLMEVHYYLAGERLMREVSGRPPVLIAEEVTAVSFRFENERLLLTTLTVRRGERMLELSGRTHLMIKADL